MLQEAVKTHCHPGKTDFRKQLRWMIDNPPEGSVTTLVTPQMAQHMLEYNDHNRPLSKAVVREYADEMKLGRWVETRIPIIFSAGGKLIDGQHRLNAIITFGGPIRMDMVFGAPDEAFNFIDRGKKRTAGDILAIHGVPNSALIAASVLLVLNYDEGTLGRNRNPIKPKPDQIYAEYLKREGLQESCKFGRSLYETRLTAPAVATAAHYILARKNRQEADDFFRKLTTGAGMEDAKDPVLKLRAKLIDNLSKPQDERASTLRILAYIIKSWNARRSGTGISQFTLGETEAFPRAR